MSFLGSSGGHPVAEAPVDFDTIYKPLTALIAGEFKTGKSSLGLSVAEMMAAPIEEGGWGQKPEDCLIVWLDIDNGGVLELLEKDPPLVLSEWKKRFRYFRCEKQWKSLVRTTESAVNLLLDWRKTHGPRSVFLIVDNLYQPWRSARDAHCMEAHGMPEHELAAVRRGEAKALGKKNLPTLSPRDDFGAVNRRYEEFNDPIFMNGLNVLILTPASVFTEEDDNGTKKTTITYKGQNENEGRVNDVVYLHVQEAIDANGRVVTTHLMNIGGRRVPFSLKNERNPSMLNLQKAIAKARAYAKEKGIRT